MSTSTISGNVGGASFSGAQVQCEDIYTKAITFTVADGSGNYTFTGLAASKYRIIATFSGYVYYKAVRVETDGSSTYSNINLVPTALTASNIGAQL